MYGGLLTQVDLNMVRDSTAYRSVVEQKRSRLDSKTKRCPASVDAKQHQISQISLLTAGMSCLRSNLLFVFWQIWHRALLLNIFTFSRLPYLCRSKLCFLVVNAATLIMFLLNNAKVIICQKGLFWGVKQLNWLSRRSICKGLRPRIANPKSLWVSSQRDDSRLTSLIKNPEMKKAAVTRLTTGIRDSPWGVNLHYSKIPLPWQLYKGCEF